MTNDRTEFCPGCNALTRFDLLYHKCAVPIVSCKTCGLGKACAEDFNPELFYDEAYFNGGKSDGYSDYVAAKSVLQEHFKNDLRLLEKLGAKSGVLLEIGCAYGYFLEIAQHSFEVHGLEISEAAVADCQSRGFRNVFHGAISTDTLAPMPMADVVALFDVIEHLAEPRTALEASVSKLLPGGILILSTGDFSSLCAKVMGRHWRLMTPPQHLWYFTPDVLKKMGSSMGLDFVYLDHPSKKVPFGLIIYQLCRYISLSPHLPEWMHKLGVKLNLFDAMRIVFRKPAA